MNKKIEILLLTSALLLVAFVKLNAQVNLVMNPSFETHTVCPDNNGGDVYKAIGWDTCRNSPDYFHSCGTSTLFQTPKNYFGYQQPANGSAYCGLYTYLSGNFYREIIIGQLTAPMVASQKYFISFKVSRGNDNGFDTYSTNKMGLKFTKVKQNSVPINNFAHYYSNTVITDTINWTKLFGSFTADSAYQYIMIGNFFDDINTTVISDGGISVCAYYYIDDVCLSTDSLFSHNYEYVGINENTMENKFKISPNPANEFINISGAYFEKIKVFNLMGEEMKVETELSSKNIIDCSTWPIGLYFIETNNKRYKIIINH